ncbi:Retrovirus-related Pol polyprotein from transposon TNT 1-94 [Vitis vinifera]|uniref:Retrovirus-related Pol polyprotein from transposon TNT 1-94 n=1 Tax=Vitis vinifera TaxID=29760 RepID=A0A438BTC4_VITVI|nr:Retrovirus-related Pol polyprotein from transposon TNT 1-94 [Vitis vinifera]
MMENEAKCEIVGMRDVELETSIRCKLVLKDVRHVPEMRFSLISVGKLDDEGYHSHLGDETRLVKGEVNIIENEASTELWHKRLGHISEKGLQVLFKKFPSHRKPDILDLVHTDVYCMQSNTLGGTLYYVTFIDDHSRKAWAYALKSKDQVLDVFKDFHVKVKRQTGKQLKSVRANNGGEYRGPFEQYCRSHGIRLKKMVPKTPQQNSVAERMNRIICDRTRCMLSHEKLPKSFWGEFMRTFIDLIDLSPSYPLESDIPERVWTGKFISFEHLRVFGCRAFVHVPKDELSKLDSKTKQFIFLGYSNEEFGYRLWDSATKKIIRSGDVVFFEDQTIEDLDQVKKPKPFSKEHIDLGLVSPNSMGHNEHMEVVQKEQVDTVDRNDESAVDDVEENPTVENDGLEQQQEQAISKLPTKTQLRRSTRERQPSRRARLVVKGFSQKKGIEFEDIFSPMVKMSSIRVVLGLDTSMNLEIKQLNVKTVFLHGDLDEEIYMEQPEGFTIKGKEHLVCRLKKNLYGLKQALRQWYKKFDSFMVEHGYDKTTSNHCMFVKKFSDGEFIILLLYVDDMLIVSHATGKIDKLKIEMSKSFEMKNLGSASHILGIKIS